LPSFFPLFLSDLSSSVKHKTQPPRERERREIKRKFEKKDKEKRKRKKG